MNLRRMKLITTTMACLWSVVSQGSLPDRRSDGSDVGIAIVGTITNKSPADNVALIKERDTGRIQAVKIGYKVLSSLDVTHIAAKYIIVQKRSNRHLIFQNKFAGEFAPTGSPSSRGYTNADLSFKEAGFERSSGKIHMTAAYRDRLIKEQLSEILMQATAVPATGPDGRVIGFRLFQIEPGSIYAKAGFQDHDIVTEINGIELNNAAGAIKLLQSLKGAEEVDLSFVRNGNPTQVKINVR